ncbi:DUF4192 family protein [Arthrobacter nitrophenolicus]|uniref:DUF4192 family protein n=1 Tax=Arthrobacter nitrophenolicus TaxID=683150 RepID=A0A4R5XRC8_9MICC|nr:DUF4192 family protein [Arthrobacter nitrophenolicus]
MKGHVVPVTPDHEMVLGTPPIKTEPERAQTPRRHHRRTIWSPREQGITIRDGLLRRRRHLLPYDDEPGHELALPVSSTQDQRHQRRVHLPRQRGPTRRPHHQPGSRQRGRRRTPHGHHPKPNRQRSNQASPSALGWHAGLRLIPQRRGLKRPCRKPPAPRHPRPSHHRHPRPGRAHATDPLAQTDNAPYRSRIEWAQQLLLHAYTRTSPQHQAPILTTIGYITWWEGKGRKAHQFLQLALDTNPTSRLARLSDQMTGSGHVAGGTKTPHTNHCRATCRKACEAQIDVGRLQLNRDNCHRSSLQLVQLRRGNPNCKCHTRSWAVAVTVSRGLGTTVLQPSAESTGSRPFWNTVRPTPSWTTPE